MTDPIDLLKERLKEIESINCDDPEFVRYRNKYKFTIRFLELNQMGGYFRRKLNFVEEECIRVLHNYKRQTKQELKKKFLITSKTLNRILSEK